MLSLRKLGRSKISLCLTCPVLLISALGVWAFVVTRDLTDRSHRLVQDQLVLAETAHGMRNDVVQVWQWLTDISATRGLDGLDDGFEEAEKHHRSLLEGLETFRARFQKAGDGKGVAQAEDIRQRFEAYYAEGRAMAKAYVDGGPEAGNRLMGGFDKAGETLFEALEPFVAGQTQAMKSGAGEISARLQRYRNLSLACFGAAVAFLLLTAALIKRSIRVPLRQVASHVEAVARGDLRSLLDMTQADEFGALAASVNQMVRGLQDMVVQIDAASSEMASAAEQLSATTVQIATSNEEVAAQSQTVATGSEEMGVTVQDVARNASHVNDASSEAHRTARGGAGVVLQTSEAMREIASAVGQAASTVKALGDQSEKIGVVVEVIEDIADQTNLLALNAAIEAARAGEHGRGFAVVADEVRKLAEKTVKATQEISRTVSSIQADSRTAVQAMDRGLETVARGSRLGGEATEAMQAIETSASEASSQTARIATATEQLSVTIREMVSNIDQIARSVEQNSAAAVQISQTAHTVAGRADELRSLTARFQI